MRFCTSVCDLVLEVTDDKNLGKLERKCLQVVKAPTKTPGAKMIKIADKTSNLRDLKVSPPDWNEARIGARPHTDLGHHDDRDR